jgi:hypothetical protein
MPSQVFLFPHAYTLFAYYAWGSASILDKTRLHCHCSYHSFLHETSASPFYFSHPWILNRKWTGSHKRHTFNNYYIRTQHLGLFQAFSLKLKILTKKNIYQRARHNAPIKITWLDNANREETATIKIPLRLIAQTVISRLQAVVHFIWNTDSQNCRGPKDGPFPCRLNFNKRINFAWSASE